MSTPTAEQTGPRHDGLHTPTQPVIRSMTGYGRATAREEGAPALTLTLKSINHRFLDLQLRLPASAEALEGEIRARLKAELGRGHVECALVVERAPARENGEKRVVATQFDRAALRRFVADFRAAAAELGLAAQPDLNLAAQLPGMLTSAEPVTEADTGALLAQYVPALLDEALAALQAMKALEGAALAAILRASLAQLSASVEEVCTLREAAQSAHFERLSERLSALVGEAFEPDRVLAEAALLAERADVEEEAARLRTHIAHFHGLLDAGGEAGKKLDFLLQEMNREANTLLSKTTGASAGSLRVTECGLAMKAEIEKLREQVQNLE